MAPHAPPTTALGKGLAALGHAVSHPRRTLRTLQRGLAGIYRERVAAGSPIPTVPLAELVGGPPRADLCDFELRDGNVALDELLAIAALVRARQPRVLLEIGTFDGTTTLQMAANAPAAATVYTLDLPPDPGLASGALDAADLPYITDSGKTRRKYARHPAGRTVVQLLGDSRTFDFSPCTAAGDIDFAFIDGSHAYEYVRSDTAKVRELLAGDGLILWHDYTPAWPGVITYLDELACVLPLRRIAGTTLVCYVQSELGHDDRPPVPAGAE